jgi:preprotein translocase subunit SecD
MEKLKINRKKVVWGIFIFLILSLTAGSLLWPAQFDDKVNFLKEKINPYVSKISLPSLNDIYQKPFELGLDFVGGTRLVYQPVIGDSKQPISDEILIGIQRIIEQRFEIYEQNAQVKIDKKNIVIEAGDKADVATITEIMNQEFSLEFREETEEEFFQPTDLTGKYLEAVSFSIDQKDQKPLILLKFNEEGAKILEALTKKNEGKRLGVYVDGVPAFPLQIQEAVAGGSVQIKMDAQIDPVKKLTQMMAASSMSPTLKVVSEKTRTSQEAQVLIRDIVKGFLLGILAILWFMIIFYRLAGLISFIFILIYTSVFLLFFKLYPIVVDFGSTSGLLFSIIIVLISLVLILKNLRKEMKKGKSYGIAIEEVFEFYRPIIGKINSISLVLIIAFLLIAKISLFESVFVNGFTLIAFLGVLINSIFTTSLLKKSLMVLENSLGRINYLWK